MSESFKEWAASLKESDTGKANPPCHGCGKNPRSDCGHLVHYPYQGDYDCNAGDEVDDCQMCDDCPLTLCSKCKERKAMDPNANYEEQLRLAQQIIGSLESGIMKGTPEFYCSCGRLAELVLALAEWREKGGFLPKKLQGETQR